MLTVITGPPAAGKSTYVTRHAKRDDIVIDYDEIANSLMPGDTSARSYSKHVARVAYQAWRWAVSEAIKQSSSHDVWIIHSSPQPRDTERYLMAGAHVVIVDPGRDVVMDRISAERPAEMVEVAAKWYRKHGAHTSGPVKSSRSW